MSTNRKSNLEDHIVFIKNLPYDISTDELYNLCGKYGAIRQIRIGNEKSTQGTALIVYEERQDAKVIIDKLSGYNFKGRYLVLLPYSPDKTRR